MYIQSHIQTRLRVHIQPLKPPHTQRHVVQMPHPPQPTYHTRMMSVQFIYDSILGVFKAGSDVSSVFQLSRRHCTFSLLRPLILLNEGKTWNQYLKKTSHKSRKSNLLLSSGCWMQSQHEMFIFSTQDSLALYNVFYGQRFFSTEIVLQNITILNIISTYDRLLRTV